MHYYTTVAFKMAKSAVQQLNFFITLSLIVLLFTVNIHISFLSSVVCFALICFCHVLVG